MKRKKRNARSKRRMLSMERLHARRVLAALDFTADQGVVSEENGTTVVAVDGGVTTTVTGVIPSSESPVQGYQLNFANSDAQLLIQNYSEGADFDTAVDVTLDSNVSDLFIASAVVGELAVPPARSLGSFEVSIPTAPGDYRLTANLTDGGELNNTILSTSGGQVIPITDFGDIIFRVEAPIVPTVEIAPTTSNQNEVSGVVSLTVTMSQASDSDVSIPFNVGGTATVSSDYSITATPLTIPAGQTSGTIDITIIDDTIEEGDETILVALGTPTGADLGANTQSTVTILANDQVVLGTEVALDFIPSSGAVTTENGVTVVTVDGGTTVNVTGQIASSDQAVGRFQLNLANSDSALSLASFVVGSEFPTTTDVVLDSSANDFFVSSAASSALDIPPTRNLGTFDVTVPTTPGDYRLTANATEGATTIRTLIVNDSAMALDVIDFGDIIFRVDAPTVTINPVAAERSESGGTTSLTVLLSEPAQSDVVVPFSITGTATDNEDFTISASPIQIPAGQTSATVDITIVNDTVDEPDETVIVTLGSPTGAVLGSSIESTLTILDDDVPAQRDAVLDFLPSSGTVTQENGTTVVTVSPSATVNVTGQILSADLPVQGFQLNLSNSNSALAFTNFMTSSAFPVSADGQLDSSQNDFFVSSALIGELTIPPTRDLGFFDVTVPQTPGDYRLTANFTTGQGTENTILSDSSAGTFNITEFGDLIFRVEEVVTVPTITLSPATQSVGENGGTVTLTATLSEATSTALQVPFAVGGSAIEGSDYSIDMSPLTIPAGQSSASLTISVIDDMLVEVDETVIVSLQDGSEFDLGANSSSTVTIVSDDNVNPVEPTISVSSAGQTVSEDAGTLTFDITLSNATDSDIVVPLSLGGSATAGSDYSISSSPITIQAGLTSATVTINLIDDSTVEGTESIVVTLGAASNAQLGTNITHTVTVTDNDTETPTDQTRIFVPDIVARPYLIPGDGIPTAIIFAAVHETTIHVAAIGSVSVIEQIIVLDESLNQVSSFQDGLVTADLPSSGLYAVIFEPQTEDAAVTLLATDGENSLVNATLTNIFVPTDTNLDGRTTPRDALAVINRIQFGAIQGESLAPVDQLTDVNKDGKTSPIDALIVINKIDEELNSVPSDIIQAEEVTTTGSENEVDLLIDQLVASQKFVAPVIEPTSANGQPGEEDNSSSVNSSDAAFADVDDFLSNSVAL